LRFWRLFAAILNSMPFRICKTFEIESGHLLSKHPDKCRFPHGHSRTVEVVLAADRLDANDMVCDFQTIKTALTVFLESWDHALCVNTADPQFEFYRATYGDRIIPFEKKDPTSEIMAKVLFEEVQRQLAEAAKNPASHYSVPHGVRVERVRVTETSSTWAEYSA
jgi:6-pyruvoyltetrahydropterin/6-carboxytetrahydropterin synthase